MYSYWSNSKKIVDYLLMVFWYSICFYIKSSPCVWFGDWHLEIWAVVRSNQCFFFLIYLYKVPLFSLGKADTERHVKVSIIVASLSQCNEERYSLATLCLILFIYWISTFWDYRYIFLLALVLLNVAGFASFWLIFTTFQNVSFYVEHWRMGTTSWEVYI